MPQFIRSEMTTSLIRYLSAFDKGASVTYGEINRALKASVNARTHTLISAREILQKEHNQVWVTVPPGIGVRRLTDSEIADRFPWWLRGSRGKLNRGRNQTSVADMATLPPDQQTRFAIQNVQAELALQALARPTAARLAKTAQGNANALPAFNLVEWAVTLMAPKGMRRK